jgi:hypothetical protein
MICYTNHALDQFLTSIIKKLSLEPGQIVRVGGRSTNPDIEPFLIQKLRHQRRDVRTKNEELSNKYEILKNIKKQMDDSQKNYNLCSQQLLDINQLLLAMDKNHVLVLIEPILKKLDIFNDHWTSKKGGIYCCSSSSQLQENAALVNCLDSSESSESEDDSDPLSVSERNQRMKNRIHCRKLNDLSIDDQTKINQLFIKWLDATHLEIITNQTNEGYYPKRIFSLFFEYYFVVIEDDGDGEFQEQRRRKKNKNKDRAAVVLKGIFNFIK